MSLNHLAAFNMSIFNILTSVAKMVAACIQSEDPSIPHNRCLQTCRMFLKDNNQIDRLKNRRYLHHSLSESTDKVRSSLIFKKSKRLFHTVLSPILQKSNKNNNY